MGVAGAVLAWVGHSSGRHSQTYDTRVGWILRTDIRKDPVNRGTEQSLFKAVRWVSTPAGLYGRVALLSSLGASVRDMVEIEEEENLSELSVTQLKKRMKERDIDASGCTEVMSGTCQHTGTCLAVPTPHPQTP